VSSTETAEFGRTSRPFRASSVVAVFSVKPIRCSACGVERSIALILFRSPTPYSFASNSIGTSVRHFTRLSVPSPTLLPLGIIHWRLSSTLGAVGVGPQALRTQMVCTVNCYAGRCTRIEQLITLVGTARGLERCVGEAW
jgi:hypothetical protein